MCAPPRTWKENQHDDDEDKCDDKIKEEKRRNSKAAGGETCHKGMDGAVKGTQQISQSEFWRQSGTWIYGMAVAGTMSGFTFYFVNLVRSFDLNSLTIINKHRLRKQKA